ncbi:MAG: AMP-binding protein, partial [Sphaerochaetaceae bacterium]|nr:AMP-binding protein [Sphaerochaetaceae bacterium]
KVAIIGLSCPNWAISFFGVQCCGCVAVPILPDFSSNEMMAILDHSETSWVVVSSAEYSKVSSFGGNVVRMDDMLYIPSTIRQLEEFSNFLTSPGIPTTDKKIDKKIIKTLTEREPEEEDLASIIYTSGTTGKSKGVMLTQRNLVWNADICTQPFIKISAGWRFFSILPLSHVYEFTTSLILGLLSGAHITYIGKAPTPTAIMAALKEIKPHVMMTVPSLMEKVYRRAVLPQIKENPKISKLYNNGLTRNLVCRIVGRKLVSTFGGHILFLGIGGAPLDKEVEEFLFRAKFPYAFGYGLTETSPFIAGCGPKQHKLFTMGKVLDGLDVRLAQDGEIQIKGPSVMKGYYKNEELTAESFTEDGYFKTGDLGKFEGKRLAICGRSKTVILGANGENIYPEVIEGVINNQEYVEESLVLPDKGGLLALVKLDMVAFAKGSKEGVQDYLKRLLANVNAQVGKNSHVREVVFQEEPLVRTPTLKIKRFLYIGKSADEKGIHVDEKPEEN